MNHLSSSESAVRALLVSGDPPTIEQLSQSLQELAASTEVCTDIPNAIRLVNTRKFETVVPGAQKNRPTSYLPPKLRTGGDGALDNALYFLNLLEVMSRQKTKAAAA